MTEILEKAGSACLLILLTLTLIPVLPLAKAAPVDVAVSTNHITIKMDLEVVENLTGLPVFSYYLTTFNNGNASAVTTPLNSAMKKLVPSASVDSLQLKVATSNSSAQWYLWENYTMDVTGANTNSGSAISANLAFLSMKVLDPIAIGSVELNNIGHAYFLSPIDKESQMSQSGSKIGWFIDGSKALNAIIPRSTTDSFSLLDFSWIPQVELWDVTRDPLRQTTSWSFSQSTPQYNLTYGPLSPEQTLLKAYSATYNPYVSLTVPANAFATGSTIKYDLPAAAELVMPIILIVSLLVLVSSLIIDRRLTRTFTSRKTKR